MHRRVLLPLTAAVFGMLLALTPAVAAPATADPAPTPSPAPSATGPAPASPAPSSPAHSAAGPAPSSTPSNGLGGQSLGSSIARIALGQVGVSDTPSSTSFSFDCDPYTTMVGPDIPNSNGCGLDSHFGVEDENEAWCSDFAKWVWERAGVTADLNLINAGASSFYAWGQAQGETLTVDPTSPQVGDAVVFYGPGAITPTRYADHVGIVSAVNTDGTVDLVDGDFLGSSNIGVELDSHVDLSTWASGVWSVGEQWVFVTPPSGPQTAAPSVVVSGPQTAVAGASATFAARASESHGSVSSYLWTFGDGGNASGPRASHVFAGAGVKTVGLTVTSGTGTVTTTTWNLAVAATSSSTVSAPSTSNWYSVTPVSQDLFVTTGDGRLGADVWDGAETSFEPLPGNPSASGVITALDYPDAADGSTTSHVYNRSANGQLAQTTQDDGTWTAAALPGSLAAGSGIVATTGAPSLPVAGQRSAAAPNRCRPGSGGPAEGAGTAGVVEPSVYYFDPHGRLTVSSDSASGWTSSALPVAPTPHRALALAQSVQDGSLLPELLYVTASGSLVATSWEGCAWRTTTVAPSWETSASTSIAAVVSGSDPDSVQVLFADRQGRLAVAAQGGLGTWRVREVAGSPAVHGTIVSTTNVLTSGSLREDASYLDAAGDPVFATDSGQGWSAQVLSGTATGVVGLGDSPQYIPPGEANLPASTPAVGGQSERLYLLEGTQVEADSTSAATPGWTLAPLPGATSGFADSIRLYAATDADRQTALAAAQSAGLPASQVTQSLSQAWDDTLSGRYLVIAVGQAAASALYYNVCGWANPSGMAAGGTPFGETAGPVDSWPAPGVFENGVAASSSQLSNRVTDLAYFAAKGTLPPGVTKAPAAGSIPYACSGTD